MMFVCTGGGHTLKHTAMLPTLSRCTITPDTKVLFPQSREITQDYDSHGGKEAVKERRPTVPQGEMVEETEGDGNKKKGWRG